MMEMLSKCRHLRWTDISKPLTDRFAHFISTRESVKMRVHETEKFPGRKACCVTIMQCIVVSTLCW
jgi:hypothetical protein